MTKFILTVIPFFLFACSKPVNQETINYEDEKILVGEVTWDGLTTIPYSEWFNPNYLDYKVDSISLEGIESDLKHTDIIVFLGTWCSDSQVEVPQFYKILDYLHYDISKMEVVALEKLEDGQMVSPQHQEEPYGVTHVPTFIFKKNGKEVGRITEYPDKSLEKDLAEIIRKK